MHWAVCACWPFLRQWKVFNTLANILEGKVYFLIYFHVKHFWNIYSMWLQSCHVAPRNSSDLGNGWEIKQLSSENSLPKMLSSLVLQFWAGTSQFSAHVEVKKKKKKGCFYSPAQPYKVLLCFLPREVPRDLRHYFLKDCLLQLFPMIDFPVPFRQSNSLYVVNGKKHWLN